MKHFKYLIAIAIIFLINSGCEKDSPICNFKVEKTTVVLENPTRFFDYSTNKPTSWFWDFGDGNSSTEQSPEHVYSSIGIYTVSLTVENENGIDTKTKEDLITIENGPLPEVNFSVDTAKTDINTIVNFTDHSTPDIIEWKWDFGDGSSSNEKNPYHKYEKVGLYSVNLTVTNRFGENSKEETDFIEVYYTSIEDIDNNIYGVVKIGNQYWMAENLKVTHYPNGTEIPLVTGNANWASLEENDAAYCYYKNDQTSSYGALYTYAAAIKSCPNGWHLPSMEEIENLKNFLINEGFEDNKGTVLKSKDWNGTNNYCFSGLPGGDRSLNGCFYGKEEYGIWWVAEPIEPDNHYQLSLRENSHICSWSVDSKCYGFSVRCIKD